MERDYYELLQITPAATFDEVHRAYRSRAMEYHPDRNSKPDALSAMVAINEAYAVLSEPARRNVLDRFLVLNHQRYEEEVKAGLHDKKKGKGKRPRKTVDQKDLI